MPARSNEREDQVQEELAKVGVSTLARHRFSSTYLSRVMHNGEHIEAAVFGRQKEAEGFFGFVEGMLVATGSRVMYIDHRPGYTTMDEFSYDTVSGVTISTTLLSASVTLYTELNNYHLSHASLESAKQFADYIDRRRVEASRPTEQQTDEPPYRSILGGQALTFLEKQEVGVLSTIERTGTLRGAVVYYTVQDGYIYFLTKQETHKARNILGNQHVAFTVFDQQNLETVQVSGIVEPVADMGTRLDIIATILHPRTYSDGSRLAPVARMGAERKNLVYRIAATSYDYTDFKNR